MEEENKQKELFEFQEPKRPFSRLARLFPKADFEGRVLVTLTPEQIILLGIMILLALVVIYAVGVEQGRRVIVDKPAAITESAVSAPKVSPSFLSTNQIRQSAPASAPAAGIKPRAPTPPAGTTKAYTIVCATFKGKDSAARALAGLRNNGLDAYITQKSSYFVVCSGAYANKDTSEALRDLARVRQQYKDAYMKTR